MSESIHGSDVEGSRSKIKYSVLGGDSFSRETSS